jgi:hypothetical protein
MGGGLLFTAFFKKLKRAKKLKKYFMKMCERKQRYSI